MIESLDVYIQRNYENQVNDNRVKDQIIQANPNHKGKLLAISDDIEIDHGYDLCKDSYDWEVFGKGDEMYLPGFHFRHFYAVNEAFVIEPTYLKKDGLDHESWHEAKAR